MIGDAPHNLPSHLQALLLRPEPETLEQRLEFIQLKFKVLLYLEKRRFQDEYYHWAKQVGQMRNYRLNRLRTPSDSSDV